MAGTGKKWLIGCGVGCGVTILLNILLFVGFGVMMTRPMNKAADSQKALTEALGPARDFQPEVDGITAARIEAFLAVRAQLMPSCGEFEGIEEGFSAMDKMDDSDEEPSAGEIIKGLGKVMGSVKGIVMEMSAVLEIRNTALLQQQMSLGEYTWIYILTYNSWLEYKPNTGVEDEGGRLSGRSAILMADFMETHAARLEEAGRSVEADLWRQDLARKDWDEVFVPFSTTSVPEEISLVLEPYRLQLEESYCPPMSQFDLDQIKKKGMSFHSN
ncbi:MAG: hypothetical protein GY780_14365 [bacterium]|nr:hypothetical protein [bacterium]